MTAAEVFEDIYRRDIWGGGSGTGSTPAEARPYVRLVRSAGREGRWESVVDLGCGDGRVAAALALPGYRGFDVSPAALALFRAAAPGLACEELDGYAGRDRLPAADAMLCKDVLTHWPNAMVSDFLAWAQSCGKWRSVYLTQSIHQPADGKDCPLGGWRPLHPDLSPLRRFKCEVVAEYAGRAMLRLPTAGDDRVWYNAGGGGLA